MKTLAIDFDGVIHAYSKGFGDGSIYDPPIPGALLSLRRLMEKYAVFIHTARDPESVAAWLTGHDFVTQTDESCLECFGEGRTNVGTPGVDNAQYTQHCWICRGTGKLVFWGQQGILLVTQKKYPALAYLDDRGIRFTSWEQAMSDIAQLP